MGSGPNGLAAAVELARHGVSVQVFEANDQVGGGVRTAQLTLAGFRHDLCSAVHPMGFASPFFRSLNLREHGLDWVHPEAPLAHPLGSEAVFLESSLDATAEALGTDGPAYRDMVGPFVDRWEPLLDGILRPVIGVPPHPILMARFGLRALRSARRLGGAFRSAQSRALLAGIAAHGVLPLDQAGSGAVTVVLAAAAHAGGWPVARGGSQAIATALISVLESFGGTVESGHRVQSLEELPRSRAVLLDLTPRQLLGIAGSRLTGRYRAALERFRYAPGVFKLDWALSEPIPWKAEGMHRAATVHVGGTFEDVAAAEAAPHSGRLPEVPFVLLAQPSLFDASRAPAGRHTAWGYCRVPHGSVVDMTEAIESRIEHFAPGFRDVVLERSGRTTKDLELGNANLVGGDLGGGLQNLRQTFARPVLSLDPYRTPLAGVYLCSASTPPGGGVHGMGGFHGARSALKNTFGIEPRPLPSI